MPDAPSVQQTYQNALDTLIEKLRDDRTILAALLFGSLSYDQVWEKSDIDLWLIQEDGREAHRGYALTENGVNIHAEIIPRSEFLHELNASLDTSFIRSAFARSTLLYSHDESIQEWYANIDRYQVGERDRALAFLRGTVDLVGSLMAAEREYRANRDYESSALHLLNTAQRIATMEVIRHGEVPGREVLQPALEYAPDLFRPIYQEFVDQPKDREHVGSVLRRVQEYLRENIGIFFAPLFQYLSEQGTARSITEINAFFCKQLGDVRLDGVCEWLVTQGELQRLGVPTRLTLKSQVLFEEPAYYRDPEGILTAVTGQDPDEWYQQIERAVGRLVERISEDRYILAAMLFGDAACGEIWECTFIDLVLLHRDDVRTEGQYSLVQDGIPVRVRLYSRNAYRKRLERELTGNRFHSEFLDSKLLFTRDTQIEDWYASTGQVGMRDQQTLLMTIAGSLTLVLNKAEKWFRVKQDLAYSFVYLMYVVQDLARLVLLERGEMPGHKPIQQALKVEPVLFKQLYTNLLHQPKTDAMVEQALDRIQRYLRKRTREFFGPVLDYLAEAGGTRSFTELNDHFGKRMQGGWGGAVYEWLSAEGVVEQVSVPRRLSKKSRVQVEELAYNYDDAFPMWE